jgi:hypothetical protein
MRQVPEPATVIELGQRIGPLAAIDTVQRYVDEPNLKERVSAARALDLHPDDWADDMADEFGIYVADIYDEFFGYEPRYGSI